jgi:rubrerythrin
LSVQHWREYQAEEVAKEDAKQAKKVATERAMWEGKRADLRAAELALKAADGDVKALSVKILKALIFSRTGRPALAKNNHDNALREEAREAIASRDATLLPPTPPHASAPDDNDYICGFCEAVVDGITLDENAFVFCPHCEARLDDFEEQGISYISQLVRL